MLTAGRFGHEFGSIRVDAPTPPIVQRKCAACADEEQTLAELPPVQRKPAISTPGDPLEREADEVADRVMRLAEPIPEGSTREPAPLLGSDAGAPAIRRRTRSDLLVSRQTAPVPSAEETLIDRKLDGYYRAMARLLAEDIDGAEAQKRDVREGVAELDRILTGPAGIEAKRQTVEAFESGMRPLLPGGAAKPRRSVQRQVERGGGAVETGPGLTTAIDGLRGRGRGLPQPVREYFEPRLGHDLARIRIHTDPAAAALATSLDALAFTVGSDIAFAAGRYDPGSNVGRRLLAHELAHSIQQGAAAPLGDRTAPPVAPTRRTNPQVSRAMDTACTGTGRWPGNYEHFLIESWYTGVTNPDFGAAEFSIPFANPSGTDVGYADLVDTSMLAIYEIKPFVGRASGVDQVRRYRNAAQAYCDSTRLWMLGVSYPFTVIPVSATRELASGQTEFPGVVGYWYRNRQPRPVPVPRPVEVPEPRPIPWWGWVGAAAGYIVWNSKGCLAGPWGCVIDWATPGI